MTNELACTWDELRKRGKQFCDLAPTCATFPELDGLWKGFTLGWLNLEGATEQEEYQAELLLRILAREMLLHETKLTYGRPETT